jgi:hypothetical protein
MGQAHWTQFEVKHAVGTERLLIVRYRGGAFRLPADVACEELLRGVREAWSLRTRPSTDVRGTVRITTAEHIELLAIAAVTHLSTDASRR